MKSPLLAWRCPLFSKGIVTLNIEADSLRFLVAEGKRVRDWGSLPLAPGLVKDGFSADPAEVSAVINTLFLEKKLPKSRVIAGLTGLRSIPRILSLPKIKSALLEEAIKNESGREMPVPLEELYLSWQLLGATDLERQFFVLGVPRSLLDAEVGTLARAGIKPCAVELKPLALARAVNREEALIIDLEPESFDLVVVAGGIPAIMRTVISRGEGMALEDRIWQLADELSRTVSFYNSSHPEQTLGSTTPAFLTGLLANDAGVCELAKAAIDNPIEALAPPLECPPDLPVAQYAVNIGLALRGTSPKTTAGAARLPLVELNLLPPEYRPRPLSLTRILYPVIAMLLVALLLLTYQMRLDSEAESADIQAELDSVNQQLHEMRQAVATINDTETEANSLQGEREAVLGTESFTDSLELVLGALPPGVRLTSITDREGRISLDGDADSRSAAIDYIAALEQRDAFSAVHIASLSGGGNGTESSLVTFSMVIDR